MKSLPFHIPEDVCIVGAQTCPHHMNICKVCFSPGFINIKENSFWRTKTWPGSAIGIQTLYGHGLRNQYTLEFLNVKCWNECCFVWVLFYSKLYF